MNKWSRRAFITTAVLAGGMVVFGIAVRRGNPARQLTGPARLPGETLLNVWLKIAPDNRVTVIVPHAEMGQGAHTSLAMMLADELDADWDRLTVLEAPASADYANYALVKGYLAGGLDVPSFLVDSLDGAALLAARTIGLQITGGSSSVRFTGELGMRVAGAAARAVLLQAAADEWGLESRDLRAEKSYVIHTASGRRLAFGAIAGRAARLSQTPHPVLKSPAQFVIIGTDARRLDAPAKVDGSATFGLDVVLPGMKHAAVASAPVFGSRLAGVDDSRARQMPGVARIARLDDAVAVVADSYWQAQRALGRLRIEWSRSGNESVGQAGIFRQFAQSLDEAAADGGHRTDFKSGDAGRALELADRTVHAEYRVPYLAHVTMEPMNCTAWIHDGLCELWLGAQNPLGFAREVAEAIGFGDHQVVVHNQYLGGGFGRRALADFARQAALIALEAPYPVKMIWSREQDIQHDFYRQAGISRFSAALDASGRPNAWRNRYLDKHDPETAPHIPYAIPHQLIQYAQSPTHVPWGYWRSVDHSLHAFFTESFIDELAHAAGSDPCAYRMALLAHRPRHQRVLERAAREAGWDAPLAANRGRGIAIHQSFGTIVAQVAEVEVRQDRLRVHRVVCAADPGCAIHPDGFRAQMESGINYGLCAALHGQITIEEGRVAQSNFHDYKVLRMKEAPRIDTFIINSGEATGGGGEPGTPPIAPALANAVFAASGRRIRELPISL